MECSKWQTIEQLGSTWMYVLDLVFLLVVCKVVVWVAAFGELYLLAKSKIVLQWKDGFPGTFLNKLQDGYVGSEPFHGI